MVELFVNRSELFECKTLDGKTPLHIAVEYGNLQIVKALFQRSNWNRTDQKSISTLVNAAIFPRQDSVLSFLKNENFLVGHHTSLHFACRQLHGHNMISHLVNPQSIMYQDKQDGFSPLMVAVQHRQLKCVKELLAHQDFTQEAFELISPSSLRTVLHICAEVNQDEITEALFERSHIPDSFLKAADVMGDTALHICARIGNVYMTKRLLFHSTSVMPFSKPPPYRSMTNLDANGRIPPKSLSTTTTTREQVLVDEHVYAMVKKKNKDKLTPLHVAIHYGKLHIIREILQVVDPSVIIEECDEQRRTSLHMAAEKGERK
jgi:ankyrin repeat protein